MCEGSSCVLGEWLEEKIYHRKRVKGLRGCQALARSLRPLLSSLLFDSPMRPVFGALGSIYVCKVGARAMDGRRERRKGGEREKKKSYYSLKV